MATDFTTNTTIADGDLTCDGQDIAVSNCTLTVNGAHTFASLLVTASGVVTHSAAPNGEVNNRLALTITGDLGVDALSRIDLTGRGYAALQGPGAGTSNPGGWGPGAGHGGVGGTAVNYGGLGGGACDSIMEPVQWGSGGGGGGGWSGGGAAKLIVGGVLRIDGALVADGTGAPGTQSGGGAGGSLWINAATLTGGGLIGARGGAGGVTAGGGAGGGGRIALYFAQNTFGGTLSAAGAPGYQNSGAGTIYTKSSVESTGHVLVDNDGIQGLWTPLTSPEAFEMVIRNQGKVTALASLSLSGLMIEADGLLSCTTGLSDFSVHVGGDVGIDAGGKLDLSGLGFATEQGPGAGLHDGGGWGAGGGHGGVGGFSNWQKSGGSSYDSILAPSQFGSGGGGNYGGFGGAALALNVTGSLRVDGTLTADGMAAANPQYGGGAGGSLWIHTGVLTGNGLIAARGGAGGVTAGGGGGGGGRIAVYFSQNTFGGSMSAVGGLGYQNGGAGTLYTKASVESTGHLLIDNGGASGEWTPLTSPEAFDLTITGQAKVHAAEALTLGTLLVQATGVLSCLPGASNLSVTVLGDAGIDTGGKLDVSGLGFAAEQGPGAGVHDGGGWGPGAGHGGVGGFSNWQKAGGSIYDSIVEPTEWGSGGGNNNGGLGGGALALNVTGSLRVDGTLAADGMAAANPQYGGGAGGSLWLHTGALTGDGLIAARGGAGGVTAGGGGGGGRIALYFSQNTFGGSMSAVGGLGYQNGGAGTVYTKLAANAYGLVVVDNGGNAGLTRLNRSLWPTGLIFDLTISGAAIVKPDAPQVFRHLVLSSGAVVSHDPAHDGFHWICLGDAWIASGTSINVDGMGYPTLTGPGAGKSSGGGLGSGAGHGGPGMSSSTYYGSYAPIEGGGTYGSSSEPVALGSGGGGNYGASGGGALRLTVNGSLHLDGAISANGLMSGPFFGSGSGGSIWITADTLVGSGSVSAFGGAAAENNGAAGGGGRIATWVRNRSGYSGTISAGSSTGSVYETVPAPIALAELEAPGIGISGGMVNFTVQSSVAGRAYQLEYSDSMTSGTWHALGAVRVGDGTPLAITTPYDPALPRRFYRLALTAP